MYLLDTDTLIYFYKGTSDVVESFRRNRAAAMALSVVTYGELVYGAMLSGRQTQNLARVHRTAELYAVLPVTRAVMDSFARVKADMCRAGTPVDDFDLVIACTALSNGLTLVTNNTRHFERIPGLRIENWARAN